MVGGIHDRVVDIHSVQYPVSFEGVCRLIIFPKHVQVRNEVDNFLTRANFRGGDLRASIIPPESGYAASAAVAGCVVTVDVPALIVVALVPTVALRFRQNIVLFDIR